MLRIGDVLQNRFQVTSTIKAGGIGAIYAVFDRRLSTSYALKEAFVTTPAEGALFEQEAQLLARLSHPALPKVIDHFSERGGQFLVMELVPGADLEALLEQRGQPFDVTLVLGWTDQLLDALAYLHSQTPPIIHRDIKPGNLKPLPDGRIKLLDFGIARLLAPGSQTVAAAKAYSEDYSPLEQFSATSHTDARSDIYALGATLYHLLTNTPPVSAVKRVQGMPLRGPSQLNLDCTPALAQVILHALALQPPDRFPDAASFRTALRAAAPAPQLLSPPAQPSHWITRGRVVLGGVVVLIGLGLTGVRTIAWPTQPTPSSPAPVTLAASAGAVLSPSTIAPTLIPAPTAASPATATSIPVEAPPTVLPTPAMLTTVPPVPTVVQVINVTLLATASASSVLPAEDLPNLGLVRYDPGNALDRDPSTSWVEGVAGPGIDESLALTFPRPIGVERIGIDVGFDRDDQIFAANNRVRRARLIFSDGTMQRVEFQDQRGVQYVPLAKVTTTSIVIVIEAVYPGSKYDDTPIAEVEIWGYEVP